MKRIIFGLAAISLSAGSYAQTLINGTPTGPRLTWLLLTGSFGGSTQTIAPFAFATEADCQAALSKLPTPGIGSGARCISATVVR